MGERGERGDGAATGTIDATAGTAATIDATAGTAATVAEADDAEDGVAEEGEEGSGNGSTIGTVKLGASPCELGWRRCAGTADNTMSLLLFLLWPLLPGAEPPTPAPLPPLPPPRLPARSSSSLPFKDNEDMNAAEDGLLSPEKGNMATEAAVSSPSAGGASEVFATAETEADSSAETVAPTATSSAETKAAEAAAATAAAAAAAATTLARRECAGEKFSVCNGVPEPLPPGPPPVPPLRLVDLLLLALVARSRCSARMRCPLITLECRLDERPPRGVEHPDAGLDAGALLLTAKGTPLIGREEARLPCPELRPEGGSARSCAFGVLAPEEVALGNITAAAAAGAAATGRARLAAASLGTPPSVRKRLARR